MQFLLSKEEYQELVTKAGRADAQAKRPLSDEERSRLLTGIVFLIRNGRNWMDMEPGAGAERTLREAEQLIKAIFQ